VRLGPYLGKRETFDAFYKVSLKDGPNLKEMMGGKGCSGFMVRGKKKKKIRSGVIGKKKLRKHVSGKGVKKAKYGRGCIRKFLGAPIERQRKSSVALSAFEKKKKKRQQERVAAQALSGKG